MYGWASPWKNNNQVYSIQNQPHTYGRLAEHNHTAQTYEAVEAGKTARESIHGAGRPQGASRLTRPGAARGGALSSPVRAAAMERVEEGRSLRLGGAARCPSGEPRGERRACNGRPGKTVGLVMCGRDRPRIQLREPHGMHPPRQAQARQLGGAMAGGPRDKSVTQQPEEPDCERFPRRWRSLASGQAAASSSNSSRRTEPRPTGVCSRSSELLRRPLLAPPPLIS